MLKIVETFVLLPPSENPTPLWAFGLDFLGPSGLTWQSPQQFSIFISPMLKGLDKTLHESHGCNVGTIGQRTFSRILAHDHRRNFRGYEGYAYTPLFKVWGIYVPGMWVSRPGLRLETDQDHFFEVLVLVLVSTLLVLVLVLVMASLVLVSVLVSACLVLILVLVSEGGLEQDLRLCVC